MTVELKLPVHALANQREPLQRTMIRHLLHDQRITMPEALALLTLNDQQWLVDSILREAQDDLALAAQLTELALRERYWQQYNHCWAVCCTGMSIGQLTILNC